MQNNVYITRSETYITACIDDVYENMNAYYC